MKSACLLLLCIGLTWAQSDEYPAPGTSCTHNGQEYAIGDRVPVDSCNTCICGGHGIYCTLMACPEHRGMCLHEGQWYANGAEVPSGDCNTCSCSNNNVICTLMACLDSR